jgi:tetratricopeptide (TPR) repeat protein
MNSLLLAFILGSAVQDQETVIAKGDDFYQIGNYKAALKKYIEAAEIKIFEVPSVYLFPKIASTYLKLNNISEAKFYIEKSYIIANIQFGYILCKENSRTVEWKNGVELVGKAPRAAAEDFCGEGYEYLYKSDNVEGMALSANYLIEYMKVSEEFKKRGINISKFK